MASLQGKHALVTGGGRGIGRAIAAALSEAGAAVTIAGRNEKPLAEVVGQGGAAGYVIVRSTENEAQTELARITDVRQNAKGFANYQDWINNTQLEQKVSLEDYSV